MVEETLKQSLLIFDQSWLMFLSRPVVVVLFLITLCGMFAPLMARAWGRFYRPSRKRAA
jgi:putative tricarboxylic transport membrane protein